MIHKAIILILILSFSLPEAMGSTQAAGAKGYLTCSGKPASGVKVKMYDDDSGVDTDDLMAETKTDNNGYFSLSGTESEMTTIDVKINIYHNCGDNVLQKLCYRKFSIALPDSYVVTGNTVSNFYNAGTIELSGKMSGESRDCLN